MKRKLNSMPDAKIPAQNLTVGKTYEVRYTVGNGSVILADDLKTLVMVLSTRLTN